MKVLIRLFIVCSRIFVFIYFMPAFQAIVFNVTLGHEPTGLKMAIVNDELNPSQGRICNYSTDCSYSMLSCRYLRYIKDNVIQVWYILFDWRWLMWATLVGGFAFRSLTKVCLTHWKPEGMVTSGVWSTSEAISRKSLRFANLLAIRPMWKI